MTRITIRLGTVIDWAGFARAVRALRAQGVAPEQVGWCAADAAGAATADLFDATDACRPEELADGPALALPRSFVESAREVFLHADPQRWPLLHRLALRIADDPQAWADPLHEDRLRFDRWLREVRREIHKMHAFVRFRRLADAAVDGMASASDAVSPSDGEAAVRHVAWFEPAHHVLEAAAPFFARRFATMRWAILTPRASVEWDGRALAFGPGACRDDAPPADAGEALWLAYYRSIFNPARVKVAMMKKEMPVRFWKNLPEAAAIPALLSQAPQRQQRMVADGGVHRSRRRAQLDERDVPGGVAQAVPLELLAREALRCRECPGADAATQAVAGEGAAGARVMIVGEQPGDEEDLRGRPFQGPAGRLLRGALRELGWPAEALYLTNAVKHFHYELRGKRRIHKTPGQQEVLACLHWLESEIATLRPRAIVALGATAVRSLLGPGVSVTAQEGCWLPRPDGTPVLVCLHPAAILRADPSRQDAMRARWIACLRSAGAHLEDGAAAMRELPEPTPGGLGSRPVDRNTPLPSGACIDARIT
jgi:DNA polymerase